MDAGGVVVTAVGLLVMLAVLLDVFLTVLYPDSNGVMSVGLQKGVWRGSLLLSEARPSRRRWLLALAGPTMVLLTFVMWVGLFVLGFALAVWPSLDAFYARPGLRPLTFSDAVYFSAATVSVLGYGDITPMRSTSLKLLSVFASASGFALFSGTIMYLLQLVTSVAIRNRFTSEMSDELGDDPVSAVLEYASRDEAGELGRRLERWSRLARETRDTLERYPPTTLFYRSANPAYDPEPAVLYAAHVAVACQMLATDERFALLELPARHFGRALQHAIDVVAVRSLASRANERVVRSQSDEGVASVDETARRLKHGLPGLELGTPPGSAYVVAAKAEALARALGLQPPHVWGKR